MRTCLRTILLAVFCLTALVVCPATPGAAPQNPASVPPVSLERIKGELEKAPPRPLKPEEPMQLPVTFKSRVDRHPFVPTLEEHLHKQFDLNLLQQQSADWASRCCGYNLGQLVKYARAALRERTVRKTREQIERELGELEAARKSSAPDVK